MVRAYDAKPSGAVFPWSLFSAEIGNSAVANLTGRLAAVASRSNGSWQATLFSYDADGRVETRYTYTHQNGGTTVLAALNTTVAYTRNLQDAVTERALTVGTNTFNHWYEYDARGLLSHVFASDLSTKPATPDVTYTYRPSGQLESRHFAGGPQVPLRYTIREQLELIGDPAGASPDPFSARYSYHPNGTVWEAEFYNAGTPAPAAKRYGYVFGTTSYDALNRLRSADFSSWNGGWTTTLAHDLTGITYDAAGNIKTLKRYREDETLIDNLSYVYLSGTNRLGSISDAAGASAETWDAETGSFTYDANGNMKTAPAPYSVTAITYDHRNLPLAITSAGTSTSYRYDEAGQRIAKQVDTGNAEHYVLDGPSTLGVVTVNGSGVPAGWHFNVLARDGVVGREPSTGSRRYYHTDALGSTRAVVEGALVVESYDPDPWGLMMPGRTLAGPTKEGFTTKERDAETGLDYFGFRYYMPALGRWTTVDPPADSFPEWSPYNYVKGNPVSHRDPFGLCPEELTGWPCLSPMGYAPLELRTSSWNSRVGQFGMVRNGGTRPHQGVDLVALRGQAVYAADVGEVNRKGYDEAFGNYVQLAHRNEAGDVVSYTLYAHLNQPVALEDGDAVAAGQVLGGAGRSGNITTEPTHLHFEIRTRQFPGRGSDNRRDPWPEINPPQ